jgi:hypothetical protein
VLHILVHDLDHPPEPVSSVHEIGVTAPGFSGAPTTGHPVVARLRSEITSQFWLTNSPGLGPGFFVHPDRRHRLVNHLGGCAARIFSANEAERPFRLPSGGTDPSHFR